MQQMIVGCHSIHEADVFWLNRPFEWPRKILKFGFFRMTLGKFSPRYSLRALGFARATGKLDAEQVVAYMRNIRAPYINSINSPIYLEANGQYTLLIDLIPKAFPNSRVVYIVRDPRDWVRSWINMKNTFYTYKDPRSWLMGGRLKPKYFPSDPYQDCWQNMDLFQKLCWLWQKENSLALELAENHPEIQIIHYEDLFTSQDKDKHFSNMLRFVTNFPSGYQADWKYQPTLLQKKVHSSSQGSFPAWQDWEPALSCKLESICQPLMSRLGYGKETYWQQLINT
jgi:hypothetical protein